MLAQSAPKLVLFTLLFLELVINGITKPTSNVPESNTSNNDINVTENEIRGSDDEQEFRIAYAQKMKTYMNESVDPCEDFYEYACGNWKNVIEERQSDHKRSNLLDIIYKLGDAVEELLGKPIDTLELEYATELKQAQQFYKSCLAADLHPMKKSEEYIKVIDSIGGFPALNKSWKPDNFSWFNMSAYLSLYGADGLVNEEITPQYPFPPYFKLPDLGFDVVVHSDNIASNTSRAYRLNEKRMREYLTTFGAVESEISQVIEDIFDFWRTVLKVADSFKEDVFKCQELPISLEEEPFKEWSKYIEIAWMGTDFNMTDSDFSPCDYFYLNLNKICNERKEVVANYLALRFLYQMDARLENKKFQKEYCIMTLKHSLSFLIDKIYLKEYFNSEIREEIDTIISEIRKSLRSILEEADWLDEATREEALLKESTITIRIGNFEDEELAERLIRAMDNLTFTEDNYELNNINLRQFKTYLKRFNGLHHESLSNETKPLELLIGMQVNAFYYNIDNSINVMAGILHPPAYHKAWPNSLKFGTIGYLIGHEFTHGFDSIGSLFDSTGDERYWWSKKSGKVFTERANCYVDHYNNYLIPEINRNINGNQTKDENIADSGGLREALSAYRRYVKKHLPTIKAEQLPGLTLSPEQLFFLGFAQIWCAAYKEEHYWEELTNEHTMDKYRVLGALSNLDDFSKVYECPSGSKMNPTTPKCRLW